MRMKYCGALLALCLCLFAAALPAYGLAPEENSLSGEAAVLMDAGTGQVLYGKNAYESREPASITKIMTGLLALEHLDPGQRITAGAGAVDIPSWGTTAWIQAGERLTVEEALYAMMLQSANEAANVLAEEVAGSQEAFARLMNARARELGALQTHFRNASGLPAPDHTTTAYDMALITRQAIGTPGFLDYFGAPGYTMPATNRWGERRFANTHRMLQEEDAVYDDAVIGGKTGFTTAAGYTLATAAERDGRTLVAVVLKSNSYYADTGTLLEYGFGEFSPHTYPLEEGSPAEASIWEGEREAGRAYFYQPPAVTLLLPDGVDPGEVIAERQVPERLEQGEPIAAYTLLRLPDPPAGMPDPLLAVPMEVEVASYPPPAAEPEAILPPRPEAGGITLGPIPLGALLAVAPGAGGCTILLGMGRSRRRRRGRYRPDRSRRGIPHPAARGGYPIPLSRRKSLRR